MNAVIIYHSKTGFTERYAKWLAGDLSCRCVPYAQRNTVDLAGFDTVVYGAGCHAGGIRKLKWFREKLPELAGKRLAVFFTGAMPPDPKAEEETAAKNLTPEERQAVKVFYLWGGLSYERMGALDKAMMAMFRKMMGNKTDLTGDEKEMAEAIAGSFDRTDRKYLEPLEEYLRAGDRTGA